MPPEGTNLDGELAVALSSTSAQASATSPGTARPLGGIIKRVIDVALVLLSLPFFGIVMLGLIVLIKLVDQGPLLYGHRRVGFGGAEFNCWKFRTMAVDGDEILLRHLAANPRDRFLWETERKLPNDPRVTRIGAVLRKLSLDELPQLLNVLCGEMSIVGPRPVVRDELTNYAASAPLYLTARPGLTGLWQVSGRSDTTYAERVRLDRQYVQGWSLWLDLGIIIRTVPALMGARGAR